jgi:predicted kinase
MPKLVFINGFPASGKSTLGVYISKELSFPIFSKDDFKELIADTIGFSDHESTRSFGKASFSLLFLIAKRLLENGDSLIIEGNFSLGEETKEFISFLHDQKVQTYEILCHGEGRVLIDRFMNRKRHPVHHTLDSQTLKTYLETTVRKGKDEPLHVGKLLEVDTTDPDSINYNQIIEFIGK